MNGNDDSAIPNPVNEQLNVVVGLNNVYYNN
jgi:hypothetical protein